jgi:hypothetical protein
MELQYPGNAALIVSGPMAHYLCHSNSRCKWENPSFMPVPFGGKHPRKSKYLSPNVEQNPNGKGQMETHGREVLRGLGGRQADFTYLPESQRKY